MHPCISIFWWYPTILLTGLALRYSLAGGGSKFGVNRGFKIDFMFLLPSLDPCQCHNKMSVLVCWCLRDLVEESLQGHCSPGSQDHPVSGCTFKNESVKTSRPAWLMADLGKRKPNGYCF